MSGLYIHIPFCKKACHYCNFHFSTSLKYKTEMVDAICSEINQRHAYLKNRQLETIYFGGGTPSLLDPNEIDQIFSTILKHYSWNNDAEITIEANPDDLTTDKLAYLAESPINRLSIGVQSFNEEELKWMNRAHTAEESYSALILAKEAGFENINADLIFGIPGSNLEKWKDNLGKMNSLEIPHLSIYALTVEEKTALAHFVKKGQVTPMEDSLVNDQFYLAIEYLQKNGYTHYEISNYALAGFKAKHNSNYWKFKNYLGIGPAAHSYNGNSRSFNIAHNHKYIQAVQNNNPAIETELITNKTRYNEYVMLSLRTNWGISLKQLETEFPVYNTHFRSQLQRLFDLGWIEKTNDQILLSTIGKRYADAAAVELFLD